MDLIMRKRKTNKSKGVLEQERLLTQTLKKVGYKGGGRGSPFSIPNYKSSNPIALSDSVCAHGSAKPKKRYTGTEILGIATMHKSNLVPVRRGTDEAEQISKMRR